MIAYPALFDPDHDSGGYVVTFPDFEYGVTQGDSLDNAVEMAQDLLSGLISDLIGAGAGLPKPSKRRGKHYRLIALPALQSAKVELYKAFRTSGVRKAELARQIGIPKSNLDRLFDLGHASRLDQLEQAFLALGRQLTIEIREAA
jgi:antitoxin HicB